MEKAPFKQTQSFGDWELKERLGIGGFAHVYLFQQSETNEKIAVKMCRLDLTPRNRDRWCREIQIMKKLHHNNVVTAKEVPEDINAIALNELPLLAMEYCSKGDLRNVLSKPENCCGLKESEVLSLLHDVGSGIQYLHENKIIHRDLKPENIVLQDCGGKVVHKIIDLGYAKDLDQGSLCTSFVGTLQYLAPELFDNKPYTVAVDFWSFGTMVFECCCGFRPFLHNWQPVQWAGIVKNKGPKDIMAVEDSNGEVKFSTHLAQPNNLSRTLVEPLENVLQLMLKWNQEQRGGPVQRASKRPMCFEMLDDLLNMSVVHILNMTTAQVLSFKLSPDESLHSLQMRIEAETKIEVVNQELLQETGVSLDPRKPANQCVPLDGMRGWDEYIVYLFDKSITNYSGPLNARHLPDRVNNIVQDSKKSLPLVELKKVWGEAVNYICGLKDDYSRLFQGQRAAMLSLLRYNTNLTRCKNSMFGFSQQLRAKLDFFKSSIQYDLEKYSDQMHYGISSEKMLKAWQENEERAATFAQVAEVSHLDDEIMALHSEIVELQRSPYARRQGDKMEQLEGKAIDIYMQLKRTCKAADSDGTSDSSEMVKAIIQTVQNQDKVLRDLYTHLSKILTSKQKIIDLFPRIEKTLESIKDADNTVMQMQIKRQKEFWHLLKIACAQNSSRNSMATSPESSQLLQVSQWSQSAQPVSSPHPLTSLPGRNDSDGAPRLLQENQKYLSQLTNLMQEAADEQAKSIVEQDWSWTKYETLTTKLKKRNA
ncbi:PREDICTED: inhibitor of nuclear factor kappa-B kinase subunit alpha-like [Poecilia mexicana]|uniref:Inhibitor of nuclear factor kappa-B kinase subunit alpha n=1 Tax=Poecilia mexicana TaxID=48701 RepID=A0A3B3XT63_9TELE|nr:PREDICTED: inhibitor of nuclear factor kappa-B kinase subunit alpha-like [Poecilia mexicana]